mgnify:FL=1
MVTEEVTLKSREDKIGKGKDEQGGANRYRAKEVEEYVFLIFFFVTLKYKKKDIYKREK